MSTVQEKPRQKKSNQDPSTAVGEEAMSFPKREGFIRFDEPESHVPDDDHFHDEEASLAQKIVMVHVVVLPMLALAAVMWMSWAYGFMGWLYVGLLFGGWYATGLGITVGYHRLFSHHSFACTRGAKVFWALMGALAVEGSPVKWCAVHRKHHKFSDHDGDPHSPHLHDGGLVNILRGFWHAHTGWMIGMPWTEGENKKYAPDLMKDPVLAYIDRNYVWFVVASLVLPGVFAGLVTMSLTGAFLGLIWGGFARVGFTHHMTWSINSICHIFGSQDYKSSDDSRNNLLFGVLSHGEGWHNNHHAFPTSARHGLKWWQFDLSWLIIRFMQKTGLAWKVRLPSEKALERRAL